MVACPETTDDFDCGVVCLDSLEDVDAAHARQPDVEHDDVDAVVLERLEADEAVLRHEGAVAFVLEDVLDGGPDAGFVVDHEDRAHRSASSLSMVRRCPPEGR